MKIPSFLYGTAWKEAETQRLTELALECGFRGIDTANQRKHYFEEAVGLGFQNHLKKTQRTRDDFFVQSKFTYAPHQDERLPFRPEDSYPQQVRDSLLSTLRHFRIDFLDSFLLHGPLGYPALSAEDFEVWQSMDRLSREGLTKTIGVSNFSAQQLLELIEATKIKPSFVQNRCYAQRGWDKEVREICKANEIVYQGFSLLTANVPLLHLPPIRDCVLKYQKTVAQVVFRFSQQIGMLPLTGTTKREHMLEDLEAEQFELSSEDRHRIETIAFL